jgi:hypothetical protein
MMEEVSPRDPAVMPVKVSSNGVITWSNFQAPRGVAPDQPSICKASTHSLMGAGVVKGKVRVDGMNSRNRPGAHAGVHVVMATVNEACRKARPTRAGLKQL